MRNSISLGLKGYGVSYVLGWIIPKFEEPGQMVKLFRHSLFKYFVKYKKHCRIRGRKECGECKVVMPSEKINCVSNFSYTIKKDRIK